MKKNKRSNAERRQRAELARRAARQTVLATPYRGDKYKTDELAPFYLSTETAIHECDLITDRELEDRDVRSALERLILRVGAGGPRVIESSDDEPTDVREFIVGNIVGRWRDYFERRGPLDRDTLVGVLRTLLGSLSNWGSSGARGYLEFVEGFLHEAGVRVRQVSREEAERFMGRVTAQFEDRGQQRQFAPR